MARYHTELSSQIAMANAANLNFQQSNKKVCKFYNEGPCSNEGSTNMHAVIVLNREGT